MAEVHVAVAVIRRGERVLIARRPDHVHQGGLLEFPGGKVEPGETVQAALVREIHEETGLVVAPDSLRPVIGIRHDYGDKRVFLDVWSTAAVTGEAHGREGQEVGWLPLADLRDADFPAANRPIIRALNLPHRYAITGYFDEIGAGLLRLERALARHRPGMVLLRAPWLPAPAYRQFAEAGLALCQAAGAAVMLHGRAEYGHVPGVAGVHLPWREAAALSERPLESGWLLAVSCHNAAELRQAMALGADFATLGPVQPTASHPDAQPLGWERFRQLVAGVAVPVFALGGTGPGDVGCSRERGGQGIAGIGYWW
ncbi:Nudix family hydrolase [Marinobacter sp. SS21]|uniref:Nudix family hydrolase n=1 Tax=Marinobacter sp. SS21 TaxID=2979460 RepID=UPI00232CAF62|nr:Nudix family hydrolase [Marinobacter sp. SS21]MDC0664068.1 Nudix family hydrolase [Marinobacter sp. SS21]